MFDLFAIEADPAAPGNHGASPKRPTPTAAINRQAPPHRQGRLGMKLGTGEVVLTSSGRATTPFPRVACDTNRKATATLQRVALWLVQNAADEARARDDHFNAPVFERPGKPSQADKDGAEEYLFGHPPAVPSPMMRPLSSVSPDA